MNIIEVAFRRILVRKTEKAIVRTYRVVSNNGKKPANYNPYIPSLGNVIVSFFVMPLYSLGSAVIFIILGFISIYLSSIALCVCVLIIIANAITTKSTYESKLVPFFVPDRRYKDGYREECLVSVADSDSVINYSITQRVYFCINMAFLVFSLLSGFLMAYFFIQEVNKPLA